MGPGTLGLIIIQGSSQKEKSSIFLSYKNNDPSPEFLPLWEFTRFANTHIFLSI